MNRSPMSVMVVDDNADHRGLMVRCLVDDGMAVVSAASGTEALAKLDEVDLVLLDHRLPGLSGLDTLRAIQDMNGPSVMMVTGVGSERLAVSAMRAGAIDYLVKEPGYLTKVPERVRRAWRHHDLMKRTSALQRLALLVTSAEDPDEIFSEIVHGACMLLAAEACMLSLVGSEAIARVTTEGVTPEGAKILAAATESYLSGVPEDVPPRVLMVPLPSVSGEPLGSLALLDEEDNGPRPAEDVHLAEAFASFAGLALHNLNRFQSERAMTLELGARASQQAAVARLGQRALAGIDVQELVREAAEVTRDVLGVEVVSVFEALADGGTLLLRGGHGWDIHPAERLVLEVGEWKQAWHTLQTGDASVAESFEPGVGDGRPAWLAAHPIGASVTVAIPGADSPMGIVVADSAQPREFSPQDVDFLQAVAHVLAGAIHSSRAQRDLAHQALHDPLTGLPNRALLLDRLALALARVSRQSSTVAVLFLDVDRFKVINDSLGHSVGDELLIAVAARLEGVLRPSDTVGRFGGDEFVIVAESVADQDEAVALAERITHAVTRPVQLGGRDVPVTISIGVVVAAAGDDAESLLRDADAAMYRAKERGRARHAVFDHSMRLQVMERLETEAALRLAIDAGELRLAFQPEVSLRDGSIVAVEALVRWQHPQRGLLLPEHFMSLAEETGLDVPLGRWVLDNACSIAQRDQAMRDTLLWVNLSARELTQPDLPQAVAAALLKSGRLPDMLGIEITEAVMMEDAEAVGSALHELRALGVHLAIDDFGTGFSSLSYLRRFPVSVLKIDRSFVAGLLTDPEDAAIVHAVIGLGHSLGLRVVAEGVESEAQMEALAALSCDIGQGFHFARPGTRAALRNGNAAHAATLA